MDYGKILTRCWYIIWTHKYLILLGVLVALGSGGGSFGTGFTPNSGGSGQSSTHNGFQFEGPPSDFGQIGGLGGLAIGVVIILVGLALLIGLAVWAASRIADGGLITAAAAIDGGGLSSFRLAWQAGWAKGWRLIGIGLLPLIPVLILVVLGLGLGLLFYSFSTVSNEFTAVPLKIAPAIALGVLACLMIPIAVVLNLLRTFADRACMLEDLPVLTSYSRGWRVLSANLGPAVILFVIQIAISIGLAVILFLPNIIMVLCCLLWPLFLLVQGTIAAYFSTLWTLAWREWTGLGHAGVIAPDSAPAA